MRSDKKVIILDNINSDCIEQAMFILKDGGGTNDAVAEAERIIEKYQKRYRRFHGGRARFGRGGAWTAVLAGIIIGTALFFVVISFTGIL